MLSICPLLSRHNQHCGRRATLNVQGNKLGNCAVVASTRETAAGGGVVFDGGLPGSSMMITTIDATSGGLATHPIDVIASCP